MPQQYTTQPAMRIDPAKSYTGTLETNKGAVEVELFPEDAPQTVNNFVCLAEDGYFDNTPFHRIVKGFVVQGGDPTGSGSGGPGYQFADEPISRDYERGTLAMANAGPNTNGSQFFIVLDDLRGKLPKNYTIFGRVTEGMDVVDAIANTPTRAGRSGENSTPTEPVTLEKVTIAES
jgi:peptidylprolyl isomerase